MHLKRPVTFLVLIALAFAAVSACNNQERQPPEMQLLGIYRDKLATLKAHEKSSYVKYMRNENKTFSRDRERVNALRTEINAKFDAMTDTQKARYQKMWREQFQPVIDDILQHTRQLVIRQTSDLTPEFMARIKELSIRRQAMEKDQPEVDLKPVFFELSDEPTP